MAAYDPHLFDTVAPPRSTVRVTHSKVVIDHNSQRAVDMGGDGFTKYPFLSGVSDQTGFVALRHITLKYMRIGPLRIIHVPEQDQLAIQAGSDTYIEYDLSPFITALGANWCTINFVSTGVMVFDGSATATLGYARLYADGNHHNIIVAPQDHTFTKATDCGHSAFSIMWVEDDPDTERVIP